MYIIAKDGSGDFTSIQAAVDAVPACSGQPTILLVRMDEYCEQVEINKDNIRLIGEARDRTVISGSLQILGSGVEVENLTVRGEDGAEQVYGANNGEDASRTPAWFLCGDSTMADYPPERAPMTGWGQALKQLVKGVHIENCAVCGRSSKSFIAEKRLNYIELCLRKGDKLFIQFSHNDEKPDVERSTHPRITYPLYLNMFIDAARRQGAEPILLTPIARRHFDGQGNLKHTHGEYPDAMRDLAVQRGVKLIEMEKATEKLLAARGDEGSIPLFTWVEKGHPNYPDGSQDNTHLCDAGALQIAQIAVELLAEQGI